jgi:hypothetical protein
MFLSVDLRHTSSRPVFADFEGGDFSFAEDGDNCILTDYSGEGDAVCIPSMATRAGDDADIYPVTSIGSAAFNGCAGLLSVNISNPLTTIGEYVFYNCRNLSLLTIPDSVTTIGLAAFFNCAGLTSVAIPGRVRMIGEWAFRGCAGLKDVTVLWATPLPIDVNTFEHVDLPSCTLHVPLGTEALYRAAAGWKDFHIATLPSQAVETVETPLMPAQNVIIDNVTHSGSRSGYLILRLGFLSDDLFSGIFFIVLPNGLKFDVDRTALLGSLALMYGLSVTQISLNSWMMRINPKTLRASGTVYRDIVKIAYTSSHPTGGGYEVKIRSLEFVFAGNVAIRAGKIVVRI